MAISQIERVRRRAKQRDERGYSLAELYRMMEGRQPNEKKRILESYMQGHGDAIIDDVVEGRMPGQSRRMLRKWLLDIGEADYTPPDDRRHFQKHAQELKTQPSRVGDLSGTGMSPSQRVLDAYETKVRRSGRPGGMGLEGNLGHMLPKYVPGDPTTDYLGRTGDQLVMHKARQAAEKASNKDSVSSGGSRYHPRALHAMWSHMLAKSVGMKTPAFDLGGGEDSALDNPLPLYMEVEMGLNTSQGVKDAERQRMQKEYIPGRPNYANDQWSNLAASKFGQRLMENRDYRPYQRLTEPQQQNINDVWRNKIGLPRRNFDPISGRFGPPHKAPHPGAPQRLPSGDHWMSGDSRYPTNVIERQHKLDILNPYLRDRRGIGKPLWDATTSGYQDFPEPNARPFVRSGATNRTPMTLPERDSKWRPTSGNNFRPLSYDEYRRTVPRGSRPMSREEYERYLRRRY